MGTAFFQGNQQSTGGRAIVNDPIHSFFFGKPQSIPATAGPWAGTAPSLTQASRGYATAGTGMNATPSLGAGAPSAQLSATFGGGKW